MKRKYSFILMAALLVLSISSCKKFLDRPPLTSENDETAWTTEEKLRLYANKYLTSFFPGYGDGWTNSNAPLMGYQFSDDIFILGSQSNFTRSVPNNGIWDMKEIRSINVMIDRIQNKMKNVLSQEAFDHWLGVGRFYRGIEYANLVLTYGDVPYYNHVLSDVDFPNLYKPRTPRDEVMDSVYNDLKFALQNIRLNDGDQMLNRYLAAGMISRYALYEGSWQKYYYKNNERGKKFLELSMEAADFLISSSKYDIVTDFRSLFTSLDLKNNKDVVFYRHYDQAIGVTHSVASSHNMDQTVAFGPSSDLIKSFICIDGNVWQNSTRKNADSFRLDTMIITRDSRLEASFYEKPWTKNKSSAWAINKFIPRSVARSMTTGPLITEWTSTNNQSDYPVFRYAEALINWVEAKAELAEIGGAPVTQLDLDKTINKIRNRPLAKEAIDQGVQKTAPLNIAALPVDPEKDPAVSSLLWEIRRERRMEFAFEHSRYQDLRRWHKLEYMDSDLNPDIISGGWVDFPSQLPSELKADKVNTFGVVSLKGTFTLYTGTNNSAMKGFYRPKNTTGRLPFLNVLNVNPYLSPVGRVQIESYKLKGYELKQTVGWPQE